MFDSFRYLVQVESQFCPSVTDTSHIAQHLPHSSMWLHGAGFLSFLRLNNILLCVCMCVCVCVCQSLSHVQLFAAPWTVAHQVSLSLGFSRQECWSRLPFPSPGYLYIYHILFIHPFTNCLHILTIENSTAMKKFYFQIIKERPFCVFILAALIYNPTNGVDFHYMSNLNSQTHLRKN